MISKKTLTLALGLIGATQAAFSTGCIVVASDLNQYLEMNAAVYDIDGYPLNYSFDYYLDMTLNDGTSQGTLVSFHQDHQKTDVYGNWGVTLANPELFVSDGTETCYDSCVSYDIYGCTAYATDCWDNSYSASFDTSDIRSGSVKTYIGIDTGHSYVTFARTLNLKSGLNYSGNTFTQSDEFDTTILVLGGAGARTQSVGGSKPSIQVQSTATSSARAKLIVSSTKEAKPTMLGKNAKLSAEQTANLNKVRKAFGIPARK